MFIYVETIHPAKQRQKPNVIMEENRDFTIADMIIGFVIAIFVIVLYIFTGLIK